MDRRATLGGSERAATDPTAERTFDVVAWIAERRLVLYVPEIEAATSVVARIAGGSPVDVAGSEAEAAVRSLISDLTGMDEKEIGCDIQLRPGRGGPDVPIRMS